MLLNEYLLNLAVSRANDVQTLLELRKLNAINREYLELALSNCCCVDASRRILANSNNEACAVIHSHIELLCCSLAINNCLNSECYIKICAFRYTSVSSATLSIFTLCEVFSINI